MNIKNIKTYTCFQDWLQEKELLKEKNRNKKLPWRKILKAKGYKKKTLKKYDWYIETTERWEFYEKGGRRIVSSIKYVGTCKYYETKLIKQRLRKGEL